MTYYEIFFNTHLNIIILRKFKYFKYFFERHIKRIQNFLFKNITKNQWFKGAHMVPNSMVGPYPPPSFFYPLFQLVDFLFLPSHFLIFLKIYHFIPFPLSFLTFLLLISLSYFFFSSLFFTSIFSTLVYLVAKLLVLCNKE